MNSNENETKIPDLPLTQPTPETTRFNRKSVMTIVAVVSAITAASMMWAFAPQKKMTEEEIAAKQKTESKSPVTAPTMPESLAAAPGSYSNIGQAGVPKIGQPLTGDLAGAQLNDQQRNNGPVEPYYSTYSADNAQGQQSLDAAQQDRNQVLDQRRKEIMEARRSSLTFGGTSDAPASQAQAQAHITLPSTDAQQMPNFDSLKGMLGGLGGAPVDQNQQEDKKSFLTQKRQGNNYLESGLVRPVSPYEVKAGAIFPGVLITGLNSDLPGQIIGQIRQNIYDSVTGKHLLIPQGTRIIGEYDSKVTYAQNRALIVWTRLIMPNGNSINLEGMPGVDLSGYAGLSGRVNNHYVRLMTGVVLGSVIGAGAQVATGGQGSANNPASFAQLAVSGAAQNINQAGQQITQKNLNLQPTLEIRPGKKFNVFVTKDLILRPYRGV